MQNIIVSGFENPWDDESDKKKKSEPEASDDIGREIEEAIKRGKDKMLNFLQFKHSANKTGTPKKPEISGSLNIALSIMLAVLALAWLSTGFYTINTDEEGVILRLGRYNRTSTPGLNYKLPSPIETVNKVSVTRINKETIGFRANVVGKLKNDDPDVGVPKESQMLTGDENIIDMHFFVQWYIKDAKSYLFNIRDVLDESTIKMAAESAMRQVVGKAKIAEALSEQRQNIEIKAKAILQEILDGYHAGIEVSSLGILYSYVAPEVKGAYQDIQSAKADKEREINEAYSYRNDILPRARGEAQSIIESAKAYKESVTAKALGEAGRFNEILVQYQKSRDITRQRMYIETMEEVLKNNNKVVVDQSIAAKSLPLMSMSDLLKNK